METKRAYIKHGETTDNRLTVEYRAWALMHQRVSNEKNPKYHRYGGRGIRVCPQWGNFPQFLQDVGRRPSTEHSLHRIDNDGNYEPGNVKWGTKAEQMSNRSTRKATREEKIFAQKRNEFSTFGGM